MAESTTRVIWNKLGIHRGDTLPYTGIQWTKSDRRTLCEIFRDAGFKVGAEVGVEKGEFSKLLCTTIPGVKLYCIDPWLPFTKNTAERMEGCYEITKRELKDFNAELMRMTSLDASKVIPDGSLDFVYIDAMHDFDNVMTDIIVWAPKVRKEGIVSGHDYVPYFQYGIIQAVNAYTQAHQVLNWYITADREPSWLWVRT